MGFGVGMGLVILLFFLDMIYDVVVWVKMGLGFRWVFLGDKVILGIDIISEQILVVIVIVVFLMCF